MKVDASYTLEKKILAKGGGSLKPDQGPVNHY